MDIKSKEYIAAYICTAGSIAESYEMYKLAAPLLGDCKFVFAAKNGGSLGFAVNRNFSSGGVVRSLFCTEKVIVFDKDTVGDMESGRATYPMDFSISLDTQALSYLQPYLENRTDKLPKDFSEVFEFIARNDVNVDPIPYMWENLRNLGGLESANKIFGKLKAYEVLRTLDIDRLRSHEEIHSKLTESELNKRTQELVARMYMHRSEDAFMSELHFRHQLMYCQLLKMAVIQLGNPHATVWEKMQQFIEFSDIELATLGGREIAIARAYFERGQKLTFFGKVQVKHPFLFEVLDGMAWDLWHVRQMEQAMTLKPNIKARYFFPAILTFDKKFIEIIDLYSLRACAFVEGALKPMPFFDGDWFDFVACDDESKDTFKDRYYSDEACASRDERRIAASQHLGEVVSNLEIELGIVSGVVRNKAKGAASQ